jgi:hypothetical protein
MPYIGKKPADIIATVIDTTTGTFSGDLTVDTNTLYVDSANNRVGVGTSSPSFPLSIQSSSNAEGLLILGRSADDIGEIEFRENDNSTVLGELQYQQNHAVLRHRVGELRFATGGTTERMRIDSSGNVGIGTSTVTSGFKLEVTGDARFGDAYNDDAVELGWSAGGSQGFVQAYDRGASAFRNLILNNSVTINSTGNVGIGTSSPVRAIHVESSDTLVGRFKSTGSTEGFIQLAGSGTSTAPRLGATGNHLLAYTSDTERMRITSGGNVGIGTSSPSDTFHVNGNVFIEGSSPEITFETTNSSNNNWQIACQENVSNALEISVGSADADASNDTFSPVAVFTSSGRLLVGTTNTNPSGGNVEGTVIQSDGMLRISREGTSIEANIKGSDGNILVLKKDGGTVGSIGANGGQSYFINSSNKGIRPYTNGVAAAGSAGAFDDAAQDLGASSVRWRNLYLSGGVYLGGTGSANKLDDYEIGAYVASVLCGTSGTITLNSTAETISYTKVGRLVHVCGLLSVASVSSPVGLISINLPFTPPNDTDRAGDSCPTVLVTNVASANVADFVASINENDARMFIQLGDGSAAANDSAQQVQAGTNITFSATYHTT